MQLFGLTASVVVTAILITQSSAFTIIPYQGEGCRNQPLGGREVTPEDGCLSGNDVSAGVASSVIVKATGTVDENSFVVFFSSDDCNPETEVKHTDSGCSAVDYKSFAVWDVGS